MARATLYGRTGWGSVLVETQLVWYGIDFDFETVGDLFEDAEARRALQKVNPVAQIPTLVWHDGQVMTESAAITLWLADTTGRDDLVPAPDASQRAAFLRWLIFITSNIYPTYTYADDPSRFVAETDAQAGFSDRVNDYAKRMYRILDGAAAGPWFLGDRFSALDIYVSVLTHWRPGRTWFEAEAPRLFAIRAPVKEHPKLAGVFARNYPRKAD